MLINYFQRFIKLGVNLSVLCTGEKKRMCGNLTSLALLVNCYIYLMYYIIETKDI